MPSDNTLLKRILKLLEDGLVLEKNISIESVAVTEYVRIEPTASLQFMHPGGGEISSPNGLTIDADTTHFNAGGIRLEGPLRLGVAAVAGAITATHTLTVQDSNGVSYKVPCVAA